MKYLPLALLLAWTALTGTAQQGQLKQIDIISFQLKSTVTPDIQGWPAAAVTLTAQRVPQQRFLQATLQLQLKRGNTLVCQGRIATDSFNTRSFGQAEIAAALHDCGRLPEGAYQLTARFFNVDRVPISTELTRHFSVKNTAAGSGDRPLLLQPALNEKLTTNQLKALVLRWKAGPVKGDVLYRVRVWAVEKGQKPQEAMRGGKPIFEKEVLNQHQTIATGLHRACNTCSYIWTVQALDPKGTPMGDNSEPGLFARNNNIDIQIDSVHVGCCLNGQQQVFLRVRNNLNIPVTIFTISYKINGVGPSIPLSPLSPPVAVNMPGLAVQNFTSSLTCLPNANTLKFLVYAEDPADPDNNETEVSTFTMNCYMDTCCNSVQIEPMLHDSISWNAQNNIVLPIQLTITPKPVKDIKAELVYYQYNPASDECMLCNKDSKTYGNFVNATVNNQAIPIAYPHTAQWVSPSPAGQMVTNLPWVFQISTPPTVSCCNATVKWCIRYVVTFTDCTVCTKLVCYSFTKTGCAQQQPAGNQVK